jgi:hypothetical protein
MSTFGLEQLEGRTLFSAGFTVAGLQGSYDGTETLKIGGIKETIPTELHIFSAGPHEVFIVGLFGILPQEASPEGDGLFFSGNVNKTSGAFTLTADNSDISGDTEIITITGKVAKNDEGQTILQFKENDQALAAAGDLLETVNGTDSFTLFTKVP